MRSIAPASCAVALAVMCVAPSALAQVPAWTSPWPVVRRTPAPPALPTAPGDLPPPPTASSSNVAPWRVGTAEANEPVLEQALRDIAAGRSWAASSALTDAAQRHAIDVHGYDTVAVLLRLATALAVPSTSSRGARSSATTTPSTSAGATLAPPPPSDEDAICHTIDDAAVLIARGQVRAARTYLDAALAEGHGLGGSHPLVVLQRLARAMPVAPASRPNTAARNEGLWETALTALPSDRPRGTVDGAEAIALYSLGGLYGLTLGAWAGIGLSSEGSATTRLLVPLVGIAGGLLTAGLIDGRRDVRRGRVYAANAGFYLGLIAAGGALSLENGPFEAPRTDFTVASALLGGATVGIGLGIGVAHATDAQPGSASFVLSGGLWGAVLGSFYAAASRDPGDAVASGEAILIGEAAGIAATMATAHWLKPTPAQTRWLDLGALLGSLTGLLVAGSVTDGQSSLWVAGLGCVAGGALGYVLGAPSEGERELERRRNARIPALRPSFSALPGGGGILHVAM